MKFFSIAWYQIVQRNVEYILMHIRHSRVIIYFLTRNIANKYYRVFNSLIVQYKISHPPLILENNNISLNQQKEDIFP